MEARQPTLTGPATELSTPSGLAVDTVNNELFVVNGSNNSVTVYPRVANGNVAPLRTIFGSATGLNRPAALVVDTVNNELLVTDTGKNSIMAYGGTANGNVERGRTLP